MWRSYYAMFRGVTALDFWISRHFTRAGLLVLGGIVLSGVFGVDTSLTLSYQIFTFLLALLLVAIAGSWLEFPATPLATSDRGSAGARRRSTQGGLFGRLFGSAPLQVVARLPHTLTAGEPFSIRVDVRNLSDRPVDGVSLRAELADPRPTFADFRTRLRFPTYRGWMRLMYGRRTARMEEARVPPLASRGTAEIELRGQALRRGRLHLAGITMARAEPLGLFRSLKAAAGGADICVLPRRYALPRLSLPGMRRYQPGGIPQGTAVGDSEEFLGLRDYRPGDAMQRIHWRSFARAGKPVVKEFQDEFSARHALVLDTFDNLGTSGTAAADRKAQEAADLALEEAIAVAASFAWTIDTQECLLDLIFVGGKERAEVHLYTAGHGHYQPEGLLEVLAGVSMQREAGDGLARLAASVRARREQLSACVCILLAWDDQRRALLDALRASGAYVLPLLVSLEKPADLPPGVHLLAPGRIAEGLAGLAAAVNGGR